MIPYPYEPGTGTEKKHAHAVRALARQIGAQWPTSRMVGGTLNARGDMVWVFLNGSPRT